MATTTNYGWTTPDDTDLVKDGAAAIRTLGSSVDTTTKALNPSTTLGDIEYRSSTANTNTRLPIGTTGQILSVVGGVPSWVANDVGDITEVQAGTGISVASGTGPIPVITNTVATEFDAKGDLVVGTGADTFDKLTVGANDTILIADSSTATGLKWAAPAAAASGLTLITPTSIANSGGSASLTGALTVATGVTSVSLNGVFSSTYTNYLIEVFAISAVSAGGIATRLRAAGTDTAGSNYHYGQNVVTYAGAGSVGGLNTSSNWDIGSGSVLNVSASSIFLFNPFESTKTNYHSVHTRNLAYGASGGMQTDSTSFDGISFIGGGTDISLSVLVYGFQK
jgi:hypothetical protein